MWISKQSVERSDGPIKLCSPGFFLYKIMYVGAVFVKWNIFSSSLGWLADWLVGWFLVWMVWWYYKNGMVWFGWVVCWCYAFCVYTAHRWILFYKTRQEISCREVFCCCCSNEYKRIKKKRRHSAHEVEKHYKMNKMPEINTNTNSLK